MEYEVSEFRGDVPLCNRCKKVEARPGRVTCLECGERARVSVRRSWAKRQAEAPESACRRCLRRDRLPGMSACRRCLDNASRQTAIRRGRLMDAGLCLHCGEPVEGELQHCARHNAERRVIARQRRRKNKYAGNVDK